MWFTNQVSLCNRYCGFVKWFSLLCVLFMRMWVYCYHRQSLVSSVVLNRTSVCFLSKRGPLSQLDVLMLEMFQLLSRCRSVKMWWRPHTHNTELITLGQILVANTKCLFEWGELPFIVMWHLWFSPKISYWALQLFSPPMTSTRAQTVVRYYAC